jgi:hypothetical protein
VHEPVLASDMRSVMAYAQSDYPVVLVVGVMRSGTTLLARDVSRSILRSPLLPEITPLSEIATVTAKWRAYEATRSATWLRSDSHIDDFLMSAFDSLLASGFESLSEEERECALGICMKDPRLALVPEEVLTIARSRDITLLVIVRNPMAVLASAYEVLRLRDKVVDVDALEVEIWHSFAGIERLIEELPSEAFRSAIIRYEDYCIDPVPNLQRLSELMGMALPEPFSELVLDPALSRMDRSDPFFSQMLEEPATPNQIRTYSNGLPDHLTERFSNTFSGLLERLGYPVSQ